MERSVSALWLSCLLHRQSAQSIGTVWLCGPGARQHGDRAYSLYEYRQACGKQRTARSVGRAGDERLKFM